jgi:adenylate kinase
MRVIFLGPPGSGKGTQSKLLCERQGLVYIGTGDMLREAIQKRTALGERVRPYVETGALVPDELVNALIAERLEQPDRPTCFILDGYPRTQRQAAALDRVLEEHGLTVTAVLVLRVPEDELVRRLTGRQRADDKEEQIRARLAAFNREMAAIAAHYAPRRILHEIQGTGGIEDVYNAIVKVLHPEPR